MIPSSIKDSTYIIATAFVVGLAGCAQQEPSRIAAEAPPGVHAVFVAGNGYHTSLVVRAPEIAREAWPARGDFPDADYFELGWGEREYYPRDDPGVLRGLRALFTPSRSTIHVIPVRGSLERSLAGREIVELRVGAAGFGRLVEFVRQSHEFDADGRAILIVAGARQAGRFYASPRTFHVLENCNVWVARALQSAGVAVAPHDAVTAGGLLRQLRRLSVAQAAAR